MRHYEKILIWENKRRITRLKEFRLCTIEYFDNSHSQWGVDKRIEEPKARTARSEINRIIDDIHKIMTNSGIYPLFIWTPPPVIGGHVRKIDIVQNIFNLQGYDIDPNFILDCVDRSIGVYEQNQSAALIRTLNPFFYIGVLIGWIVELPFLALAKLGLDRGKAESSTLGKFIKGVLYLITVIAALLTTLQLLGYLDPVKVFLDGLIK